MHDRTLNEPSEEVLGWFRDSALPLTEDGQLSGADVAGHLASLFGDARVVLLGETNHGTSEICELKSRVVQLAIECLGFTTLALEAPHADFLKLDAVVQGRSDSDGSEALGQIYHYNTAEFRGLIDALRAWNAIQDPDRAVGLVGWDPNGADTSIRLLLNQLAEVSRASVADGIYRRLRPLADSFNANHYRGASARVQNATVGALADLGDLLAGVHGTSLLVSHAEHGERLLRARTSQEWMSHRAHGGAELLTELLRKEGRAARVIGWAHSAHFQLAPYVPGVSTVGALLRRQLGSEVTSVGVLFGSGSFRAVDPLTMRMRDFELPVSPAGTVDELCSRVGLETFAVDLRSAPRVGPVNEWFRRAPHRVTNSVWSDDPAMLDALWGSWDKPRNLNWTDIRDCFDVVLFVNEVSPHTGLDNSPGIFFPAPPSFGAVDDLAFHSVDGNLTGWTVDSGSPGAEFEVGAGERSLELKRVGTDAAMRGAAQVTRSIDGGTFGGVRLRFTADVEVLHLARYSTCVLFIRVERTPELRPSGEFDSPLILAVGEVEVEVDLPPSVGPITFGFVLSGSGHVVFRRPSIERR